MQNLNRRVDKLEAQAQPARPDHGGLFIVDPDTLADPEARARLLAEAGRSSGVFLPEKDTSTEVQQ